MYLVSACLAGMKCRYDGQDNTIEKVVELVNQGKAIPICPEQLGGLTTPRAACEILKIKDNKIRVVNKLGEDKTEAFRIGAERSLAIAKSLGVKKAILKAKSPSCGCGKIYDGTFEKRLVDGNGLTADLFMANGITVCSELDLI